MNPHYERVAGRARRRCEYCRAPEAVFNFPFEVEHSIPTAQGGTDELSNLALACRACNLHKSDHRTGDDGSGTHPRLFHPREDVWSEHFAVDPDSGEIQGLTPVGRATVYRLQLNHPLQLLARDMGMRLKLFP